MKNSSQTLRTRLLIWYLTSLVILAVFFYSVVHIWQLSFSTELFFLLLFFLAASGFFIVRKMTSPLTSLTVQIQNISSRNLDTHIKGIKSRDEIGELAKTFNDLLDRLNEAFKREQQFIFDVAHELKTPLSTQRSSLEVVLSQKRPIDDYRRSLEEALIENQQVTATLNSVLDLAWSELPHEQKHATRLNLSELMEDIYDITVKMSLSKKIKIDQRIKKNIHILGFKDKLARAILNIVENAVKYTPAAGKIMLRLNKIKNNAIITVLDTGQGIKKSDLLHIFSRFYRGSSTDNVSGSGLGLAISKSVIALHKGTIHVKSAVGKGSAFIISLPLEKNFFTLF
ncbi:HAMP domain-containing protein [Candidatus Roizmanbacteria bacterium]|nr:HAMP domain-containing protein [Candidatus Roizmanbacteria bacterium]